MDGCNFVALDLETANPDQASICSVGLAIFRNGTFVDKLSLLVNPEDYFDNFHVAIHGIAAEDVKGASKWSDIVPILENYLADSTVVHHTHFDRVALRRAAEKYGLLTPTWRLLDSALAARRTWEDCAYAGYGLPDLAQKLGITFRHHDAADDARVAGHILIEAIKKSGIPLEKWHERVDQPMGWIEREKRIERRASEDVSFTGETVVFTGKLERLFRNDGADLAAAAGFNVDSLVTKRTTVLVVGEQHLRRLKGDGKSSKHLKAEKLSLEGQQIRIIGETDFLELVGYNSHGTSAQI